MTLKQRLNPEEAEKLGAELDAIAKEVRDDLGAKDRRYILRMIRVQRSANILGRLGIWASVLCLPTIGLFATYTAFTIILCSGILLLALGKILENMEIGHNVIHGQWDWMNDPNIHSSSWEWDHACPSSQWKHTHNAIHHQWTNVLGRDRDIGYSMVRITSYQPWHPFFLLQPLNSLLMALFFEWFIMLHDWHIPQVLRGADNRPRTKRLAKEALTKMKRQLMKDYVWWPLLAGPFFFVVMGANFIANCLRNVWTWAVIFCGHFPSGVKHFHQREVKNETRGEWYFRQIQGSCNIRCGKLMHILTGNLSHQIEHHLFPDMPSNRYKQVAPQVEAICKRYGIQYHSRNFVRQVSSFSWNLLRLSFPKKRPRRRAVA